MNKQEFYKKFEKELKDLQNEFSRETEGMIGSKIGQIVDSMMLAYDVFENEIVCDFCSGSYGIDLPYSNARGNSCLFLNTVVLWADDEDLKGIMEQAVREGIKYWSGELENLTDGTLSSDGLEADELKTFQEINRTLNLLKAL